MKKFALLFSFVVTMICQNTDAQIVTPQPSPKSTLTQRIGLTDLTLNYSRPGAKGRVVFGDVVAYDKVWRTGANDATKLSFNEDIMVEGQALKAGEYAIYTIPGKDSWDIIFYKDLTMAGNTDKWKEEDVVLKVKVKPMSLAQKVETMTFDFANLTSETADLMLCWENTAVKCNINANPDTKVMKTIQTVMAGPSSNDYFAAGRYYLESGKDAKQAYEWLHKANESSPKFYMLRQEALALAKLGRYKEAIEIANKSTMMAKEAKNDDYVKMNTKDVTSWSKM